MQFEHYESLERDIASDSGCYYLVDVERDLMRGVAKCISRLVAFGESAFRMKLAIDGIHEDEILWWGKSLSNMVKSGEKADYEQALVRN